MLQRVNAFLDSSGIALCLWPHIICQQFRFYTTQAFEFVLCYNYLIFALIVFF